jgi:hypothetical protein
MSDCSLGASWAFSFQQVLLPENRPWLPCLRREVGPGLGRCHLNSAVPLDRLIDLALAQHSEKQRTKYTIELPVDASSGALEG